MLRIQLLCLSVLLSAMVINAIPNKKYDEHENDELNDEEYENNSYDDYENIDQLSPRCGHIGDHVSEHF